MCGRFTVNPSVGARFPLKPNHGDHGDRRVKLPIEISSSVLSVCFYEEADLVNRVSFLFLAFDCQSVASVLHASIRTFEGPRLRGRA